jgi:hypothetical protein
MNGIIVTFYSWKGGVGRTMALANTGVQLARRGKRVLIVDWDLEAPGLDRYFLAGDPKATSQLKIEKATDSSGLLGLLTDAAGQSNVPPAPESWQRRCTVITVPPLPANLNSRAAAITPAPLHLLPSGYGTKSYAERLHAFSWPNFFASHHGPSWLEALREQWRAYDLVLIDSRTGLTDSGGICTVQMPDMLVLVFTANGQSVDDGRAFVAAVQTARADFAYERPPLSIIPLLARWEGDREVDLAEQWLERLEPMAASLAETWLPSAIPARRLLERLRVPHVARFSFGEPLPVLTHSLTDPDRPGLAYDLLSELLASGLADAGTIVDPQYVPAFDPYSQRPSSQNTEMAVATVKRYLGRPEFRIQLNDFLADEYRQILGKLRDASFAAEGTWSDVEFRRRVARYEAAVERLARILGVIGRWGDEPARQTSTEIVRSLAYAPPVSGLSAWINLRTYPAMLLLYGFGLGALKAGEYKILFRWLTQQVRREGRQMVSAAETLLLAGWSGYDQQVWQKLDGLERRKTPLSDHLHDVSENWTADYLLAPAEHTELFERFEVLAALALLTLSTTQEEFKTVHGNPNSGRNYVWAPVGRTAWHREMRDFILADIERPEMASILAAAGFGRGDPEHIKLSVENLRRLMARFEWM